MALVLAYLLFATCIATSLFSCNAAMHFSNNWNFCGFNIIVGIFPLVLISLLFPSAISLGINIAFGLSTLIYTVALYFIGAGIEKSAVGLARHFKLKRGSVS